MLDLSLLKKEIERKTNLKDISFNTRKSEYTQARAVFFHIARTESDYSLNEIGSFVNKDHATVLHSIKMMPVYLRNKDFKNLYNSFNPEEFSRDIDQAEEEIRVLRQRVFTLQEQLKRREGARLKSTHQPLLDIINNIPAYHIELVKARLDPIVKMLERPSRHNYLPQN